MKKLKIFLPYFLLLLSLTFIFITTNQNQKSEKLLQHKLDSVAAAKDSVEYIVLTVTENLLAISIKKNLASISFDKSIRSNDYAKYLSYMESRVNALIKYLIPEKSK